MANQGKETIGATARQINGIARGRAVTSNANATLVSITAYISDSATGDSFEAAIYDNAGNLLAESATRTNISTAGWYTFTGGTLGSVSLVSGTTYHILVGSTSAANADAYYDAGGTGSIVPTLSGNVTWPASNDFPANADSRDYSIYLTDDAGGGGGSTTISNASPQTAPPTVNGRAATINNFSSVAIKEVFINEAGSPVTNRTGMSLLVWYSGSPSGAPDLSYSALTTDAAGTASWSLAPGTLVFNQPIFYVATDGGASLSMYTCARMIPTYT